MEKSGQPCLNLSFLKVPFSVMPIGGPPSRTKHVGQFRACSTRLMRPATEDDYRLLRSRVSAEGPYCPLHPRPSTFWTLSDGVHDRWFDAGGMSRPGGRPRTRGPPHKAPPLMSCTIAGMPQQGSQYLI